MSNISEKEDDLPISLEEFTLMQKEREFTDEEAQAMSNFIAGLQKEAETEAAKLKLEKEREQEERVAARQSLMDELSKRAGLHPVELRVAIERTEAANISDTRLLDDAKDVLNGLEDALRKLEEASKNRSPFPLRAALDFAKTVSLRSSHPTLVSAKEVLEVESQDPWWEYTDRASLQAALLDGSVRLLRPEWLIHWYTMKGPPFCNPGLPLPKRQECPEEAFVDVKGMSPEDFVRMDIIAVSYPWLHENHPDPSRYHLDTLKKILELYVRGSFEYSCINRKRYTRPPGSIVCGGKKWGQLIDDDGMLHKDDPEGQFNGAELDGEQKGTGATDSEDLKAANFAYRKGSVREAIGPLYFQKEGYTFGGADGRPVGIFLDWCSLYQDEPKGSRTTEETEAYERALRKIHIWYAHQETIVWMLNYLPHDCKRPIYLHSGWPRFERSIASIMSKQTNVLNITEQIRKQLLRPPPLRMPIAPEKQEKNDDGVLVTSAAYLDFLESDAWKHWELSQRDYLQLSLDTIDKRPVPLTTDEFNSSMYHLYFAHDAEFEKIIKPSYEEVFYSCIMKASKLSFSGLGYSDDELSKILQIVEENSVALKVLDLSDNDVSKPLLKDLARIITNLNLQEIRLCRNSEMQSCPLGSLKKCTTLMCLDLRYCTEVKGEVAEIMGLVNLTELNLSNTRITGDTYSFYPLKMLKKLNLDFTKIEGDMNELASLQLLEVLNLARTLVTGDLISFSNLSNLRILDLENIKMSGDTSIGLRRLTALKQVNLQGTLDSESDETYRQIRQAIPLGCRLLL